MVFNIITYCITLVICFGAYYYFKQRKPYLYHLFWALLPTFLLIGILQDYFYSHEGYSLWQRSFRLWAGLPVVLLHIGIFHVIYFLIQKIMKKDNETIY
ncbi:MAG: hypothetical protein NZ551_05725 [Microscillaceae bacterium]|nr:hypothetical protein [Microscillaceae bacterium]MDW8460696.1 hypothetical protein [Cytophagales bacterium]